MWYFVWILAVLLSLATGLLAVMWVDVRSRPLTPQTVLHSDATSQVHSVAPGL